jgi:hypothetical protein
MIGGRLNTYVILLRRMDVPTFDGATVIPKLTSLDELSKTLDVQILDLFAVAGAFDAVLVCRSPDNWTVARLLNRLDGWHTDTLLAESHVRWEVPF